MARRQRRPAEERLDKRVEATLRLPGKTAWIPTTWGDCVRISKRQARRELLMAQRFGRVLELVDIGCDMMLIRAAA